MMADMPDWFWALMVGVGVGVFICAPTLWLGHLVSGWLVALILVAGLGLIWLAHQY